MRKSRRKARAITRLFQEGIDAKLREARRELREINNVCITDSRDKSQLAQGKQKRAGCYATRPRA